MAYGIVINLENTAGARNLFNEIANNTMDYTVPLERSGEYMEGEINERFERANWERLHPMTYRLHPHRIGGKPLNDTGRLRRSVTSDRIEEVRNAGKQLLYATDLVYSAMHNFGGIGPGNFLPVPYANIPQREFMYFTEQNKDDIQEIFADYLREVGS